MENESEFADWQVSFHFLFKQLLLPIVFYTESNHKTHRYK